MNKLTVVAMTFLLACIGGCGVSPVAHNESPSDIAGDAHHFAYDALRVNVDTPFESHLTLAVEGSGQAAKEGFKMLAVSPLGCLSASMYAGVCMAMAPFFPIIAAVRAEDPEVARAELEAFFERVADYDLEPKLTGRLTQRIEQARLPVANGESVENSNTITVSVFIPPLELEHSGYKNGGIDMTMRYIIELADTDGLILARKSGRNSYYFTEQSRSTTLYPELDRWLDRIVEQGIDKMLLEWQPQLELAYRYPGKARKRAFLWIKHLDWAPVDTLTPLVTWQALEEVMPAERMAEISELSYELDVYAVKYTLYPAPAEYRFVAEARGLTEPTYQIETELLPCMRYYWKPRARFRHNGVIQTTSLTRPYVLITPGDDCREPAWVVSGDSDWSGD